MVLGERESDEIRDLFVDIGRTLLACSMVERHLHDLLRPNDVRKWLESNREQRTMHAAIEKLKKEYTLDQKFVDALHTFRKDRNRFVHETWDIGKARLNTTEGRAELLEFVTGLYLVASTLNKVLWPVLAEGYRAQLGMPQEWGVL